MDIMDINFITEPGYLGTFTRDQADEALYANGSRIKKITFEKGDSNEIGAQGTVLGSIHVPGPGTAYFVEWDNYPRKACLVTEYKIGSVT